VTEGIVDGIVMTVLGRAIMAGTPLLLGTLGEILTERAGILNLGVEGMMAMGAISSFIVAFKTGSVGLAVAAAVAATVVAAVATEAEAEVVVTAEVAAVVADATEMRLHAGNDLPRLRFLPSLRAGGGSGALRAGEG